MTETLTRTERLILIQITAVAPQPLNLDQIAQVADIPGSTTRRACQRLTRLSLLARMKSGNRSLYSLAQEAAK